MNQYVLTASRMFFTKMAWLILLAGLAFYSCKPRSNSGKDQTVQNGKLIKAEKIGEFDTGKLRRILNEELQEFLAGAPMPFDSFRGKYAEPANSITLYKLTFQSSVPEKNNEPVEQTGLVAIPAAVAPGTPMVSYQHGTVFAKNEVPSNIESSMETKLMLAQFGGQGYIVIAADYHGLGESPYPNAYFSRRSTEQSCLDMHTAAREFLEQQKIQIGHFFLLGWSQGAYNTLVFLRRLEQARVPVVATVTAATPADPNFFISHGILNPRPADAVWLPAGLNNMLYSYENYMGVTGLAARAIKPQYLQASKDFYEFKIGFPEFLQKTTPKIVEYLNPEFVEEVRLGSSPFCQALNQAEGYRWKSKIPLRSYYGAKDECIPPTLGRLAIEYQQAMGKTNGELAFAGENADHRCTYTVALYDAKAWLDAFIKK